MRKDKSEILHYSIEGAGPNLILIHGFLESNAMWEPLNLGEHYTCIKIELPGHGISKVKNFEASIPFMASCINTTLKSLGLKQFDMIGHSLGGYVLLEYAQNYGLAQKLILLHSNFWEDDEQKKIDRQRVADIVIKNKNFFLNEALPALFLNPKKHFTVINNLLTIAKKMKAKDIVSASIAMQQRKNHKKTLTQFSDKIFIIQGEKDKLVPLIKMKEMTLNLKNKMVIIPGVGHMGQHEKPTKVRKEILNFLP
jgi:pimeloyl-ACP methyl ester carboxylesterase